MKNCTFNQAVDFCKEGLPDRGDIYKDNPNLGLVASLVKWHRICTDVDPVIYANDLCGLCYTYLPDCSKCGLGSITSRCTDPGMSFYRVNRMFKVNQSRSYATKLSGLPEEERVMYTDMYGSVRKLCTQEQLDYFDSVFQ